MLAQYEHRNKLYKLYPCSLNDIQEDMDRVLQYWVNPDLEQRRNTLEQCISNETAIKITLDNEKVSSLYYRRLPDTKEYSNSLYGELYWLSPFMQYRCSAMFAHYLIKDLNANRLMFPPSYDISKPLSKIPFSFILDYYSIHAYKDGLSKFLIIEKTTAIRFINKQFKHIKRC